MPVSPTAGEVNNDEEKQWHGKFTQEESNIICLDVQTTKVLALQ